MRKTTLITLMILVALSSCASLDSMFPKPKTSSEIAAERRATEKAQTNPKKKLIISICQNLSDKKMFEQNIKDEWKAGKKYGVINKRSINEWKQYIYQIDVDLKKEKRDYQKLTGKKFKNSLCNKKDIKNEVINHNEAQ